MKPYYEDGRLTVWAGDCVDVMAELDADTFDSVVTDPPYGIGFMGHAWDQPGVGGSRARGYERPNVRGPAPHPANEVGTYDQSPTGRAAFQAWCESWGRAAFRVAKPGAWLLSFGSPRSHHRLAIGLEDAGWEITDELEWLFAQGMSKGRTTLKPAHEPIVLARKPARRVTPLQIDEVRIPFADAADEAEAKNKNRHADYGTTPGQNQVYGDFSMVPSHNFDPDGRWPANVVLTDPVLDADRGGVVMSRDSRGTGSYSRYFLIPKANRTERNAGLEDLDEQPLLWSSGTKSPGTFQSPGTKRAARNFHPTVKPLELMDHLVRLVTPAGGVCLDPFLGSGTTAVAAVSAGRMCVGIERDPTYLPIIPRRMRLLRSGALA